MHYLLSFGCNEYTYKKGAILISAQEVANLSLTTHFCANENFLASSTIFRERFLSRAPRLYHRGSSSSLREWRSRLCWQGLKLSFAFVHRRIGYDEDDLNYIVLQR